MIRDFFRASIIYTVPTFISRGLSIFLVPLYTRVLSPADYGALDMLMVFGSLVNLTIALEVSQGVARYYSDESDAERKILYASSAFWFTFFCYTIFLLVTLVLAPTLSRLIMGVAGLEPIFRVGMFYLSLNGLFLLIHNQFRWELRSKNYAVISILVTSVTASVSITLAYVLKWGLSGLLYGMAGGALVGVVYGLLHLRNSFRFRFQTARLKEMLAFSGPLVPSGIAVFINHYVARLMINHYLSLGELGIYGIGFRVASIVGLVMVGFQSALTPLIYANYRDAETPRHLAQIFRVFLGFSLLIFLGLSIFAREILWVMTTKDYYSAAQLVIYLVPAILLSSMYIFAPGIDIAKKTHMILWINLGGAIVSTFLNWLLIPKFGITGAAVATLLAYTCIFTVRLLISQRLYRVPHKWSSLCPAVFGTIVLAFIGIRIDLGIALDISVKIVFLGCAGLLFMVTGLVRRDEVTKVMCLARQRFVGATLK